MNDEDYLSVKFDRARAALLEPGKHINELL